MTELNQQAITLNDTIRRHSHIVYELLSEKGKAIFFPKKGILSQTAEAKGKAMDATIGIALEEDRSPMRLKSIAKKIKLPPQEVFPYGSSSGKPELREAWKKMLYGKNPSLQGKEISLPIVTSGMSHALSIAGFLFIDQKTTIILPDLYWENYDLMLKSWYNAEIETFPTFKQGFNVHGLKEKLSMPGKKIVLLNFPNNPTGYSPTEEEAKDIVAAIKESAEAGNKLIIIIDDAYFGLVYEKGILKESLFAYLADLHENVLAIKIDGPTKEDYVWGFRVGFLTFGIKNGTKELYTALEEKTAGSIRGNISMASTLSQSLVYQAFASESYAREKKKKFNLLKKRYKAVVKTLKEHQEYKEFFEPYPFNSGYFMCLKLKRHDAEAIRQKLLQNYNTGTIAFNNILRIAFSAVPLANIEPLFENIYKACKE